MRVVPFYFNAWYIKEKVYGPQGRASSQKDIERKTSNVTPFRYWLFHIFAIISDCNLISGNIMFSAREFICTSKSQKQYLLSKLLVYLFSYRTQFFVVSEALLHFSRDNSWFLNVQRQCTKLVDYEPINCVVILAHYAHEPIRWRLILVITKGETSKTRNLK